MNAADDHARFAEWDAAYVLGALPAADRAAYEEHVPRCGACRSALAELSPLPGLLSRVPADHALRMLGDDADDAPNGPNDPDDDAEHGARPSTGRAARDASGSLGDADGTGRDGAPAGPPSRDPSAGPRAALIDIGVARARRRRAARWGAGALAAAAAAAAIVALPTWLTSPGEPDPGLDPERVVLTADADVPIEASVELTDVPWGTRVEMDCRYDGTGAPGGTAYALVVVSADGTASELSTWRAHGGTTAELSAATALDLDEIASVEIRFPGGDAPLLIGTLPAG